MILLKGTKENMIFNLTLNDVYYKYFDYIYIIVSKHTLEVDISYFNKHIKNNIGLRDIKDLTFLDLQLFCNNLIKQEYKIKTVYNILSKLKVVFKFAIKLKIIDSNPASDVILPKYDNRRYFSFSVELQEKYIKTIRDNKRDLISRDIFIFLLHGRRFSEVSKLEFKYVDFENKIYTVPCKINKAKRDMIYKMTDELYKILLKYYEKAKIAQNTNSPTGFIFINSVTNSHFTDIRRSWKNLLKTNNLPYIRLHDIRHLIGTYSINTLKLPIEHVQIALGHTDIKTTQRYITSSCDISKNVIDNFLNLK